MLGVHEHAIYFLNTFAQNESIPHALLFTGFDESRKKDIAIKFIQHVLHEDKKDFAHSMRKVCICKSCHLVSRNFHPDFTIINDDPITIERIRDLKHKFTQSPLIGCINSVIISAGGSMRAEAANALLKMLEEPEGNALFILLAKSRSSVLSTIASRTLEIRFAQPSSHLEEQSNLQNVNIFEKGSVTEKFFFAQRFHLKNSGELIKNLDSWIIFLRKHYLCKNGSKITADKIKKILRLKQIIATTNANPQLLLEELFLSLS